MQKITIIVPSYNEEECVVPFYEAIKPYMEKEGYSFTLLYVDDGSKDKTKEKAKELHEKDERVNYISFSRNFGKEAAMLAGLKAAQGSDAAIIMDADLQHPPYLIHDMIEKREEGYKIVYAKKRSRKGDGKLNTLFANMFYNTFDKYADIYMERSATDYMILDKDVIDAFLALPDQYRFTKGITSFVGFKKYCLEFDFVKREKGTTKWNFKKLFKYGVNGLNQFSSFLMILPKGAIFLSFLVMVASVLLFVFKVFSLESFLILILVSFLFFITNVVFLGFMFLLYSTRREALKRPIYFIEEASIDEKVI
ncbi:MAG: glycosyltransferase [Gammaproteobacteria bacterium]|nr:glycosyltransferase [Gammaproteobacteria bacterium]